MTDHLYFQSHDQYFWQWEENMDVIAIPNENTIVYRQLVIDILEKLAPQGLPPFGAVLLVLVATNPNGSTSLDAINEILKRALTTEKNRDLSEAISFLKLLTEIPTTYKEGKKRILLFMALFQNCHNILSIKDSLDISNFYHGNKQNKIFPGKQPFDHKVFRADFRTISLLCGKFQNARQIIERIASLPEIGEEIVQPEENLAEEKETEDLIEQLENNYKTFHVGSLVKRIWGGLNIPVHSTLPSQQPFGGVSDLTNKGDFNNLLVSEFANDDITFLSRLANNEALYIHREIPPITNDLHRVILIDVSLKCWGTPKVLAYAIMLAIAKHPKTNIECAVYALGDTFYPLSFKNIDSIIEALQILAGTLHAAVGLEAFFKKYPETKNREIFIITDESAQKHAPILKVMQNYHQAIHYWIYTNSEGSINIYKKHQKSKRHLQHIQLPLPEIWNRQKAKLVPAERQKASTHKIPILVRNSFSMKKIFCTEDGEIYQITKNKALLRLYDKTAKQNEKGWEIVREDIPFVSGEFEIGLATNGNRILLMFNPNDKMVSLLNLDTDERVSVMFPQWKLTHSSHFTFYADNFFYSAARGYFAIALNGVIEKDHSCDTTIIKAREDQLAKLAKLYSPQSGIFKNIYTIFINESHHLVFNIHELYLNNNNHIKLDQTPRLSREITATKGFQNEFVFSDGSAIEVNPSGILILKSSSPSIPIIYIPSVIDLSLGAATGEEFAGNLYFYASEKAGYTGEPLKCILPSLFYKKYIETFIETIQSGATKN